MFWWGWTRISGSPGHRRPGRTPRSAISSAHPPSLQEKTIVQQTPLLQLVVSYLPSIFISTVNFVLPPVFNLIGQLEGYTRSHQIVLILLRFQPEGWTGVTETGQRRGRA